MSEYDSILAELSSLSCPVPPSPSPASIPSNPPSSSAPSISSLPRPPPSVFNFSAPLPLDVANCPTFGAPVHVPRGAEGSQSDTAMAPPPPPPPPSPFVEFRRRAAFEKLKSSFSTLLQQSLCSARLSGSSPRGGAAGSAKTSSGGRAAFERWHFAVKMQDERRVREWKKNRESQHDSISSSSSSSSSPSPRPSGEGKLVAFNAMCASGASRVKHEILSSERFLSFPTYDKGAAACALSPTAAKVVEYAKEGEAVEIYHDPILMCNMSMPKKSYNLSRPPVDADFSRELSKLGVSNCGKFVLEMRGKCDGIYGNYVKDLRGALRSDHLIRSKSSGVKVSFEPHPTNSFSLTAFGATMKINKEHYEKARLQFAMFDRANRGDVAPGRSRDAAFHTALYSLLTRYDALSGPGFQASITSSAFDVLLEEFDCRMECFASPLNCRYPVFCSAFKDLDCWFGSVGSFFDFKPSRGSFQANPPFVPDLIFEMSNHMEHLLDNAAGPLSFVIIVPAWVKSPGWKRLSTGKHLVRTLTISQSSHSYKEGTCYRRKSSYRVASFDTSVFWWQNESGREMYKVDDGKVEKVRVAMSRCDDDGDAGGDKGGEVARIEERGREEGKSIEGKRKKRGRKEHRGGKEKKRRRKEKMGERR